MYGALFPREQAASLNAMFQRANGPAELPEPPGAFTGFGSALADAIPHAALTSASAWGAMLNAVQRSVVTTAAKLVLPTPPTGGTIDEDSLVGPPMVETEAVRRVARGFAPDPEAVGMAGQITHGVISSLAKAGAYSLSAGPAAPVLFGADLGIGRAQELTDQGVDGATAAGAGVITGVASAVGMRLPAAMGATRLKSAAIGAAVNPALNVAEMAGIRALLDGADYERIAAQYKPLDPVNLIVAATTGAAFGAAFHRARPNKPGTNPEKPPTTPDEHAAALTMHEVRVRDGDTLVGRNDIEAINAAHDAQMAARDQLEAGEPVSVADRVAAEQAQLAEAYRRVHNDPMGEAFDPLVHIQPDDIEGVIIARGGWKGLGDIEVKGSGWGLVKFIWKHGEESRKAPEFQIVPSDILAFPQIIRNFEPLLIPNRQGGFWREWRVELPDADGRPRTVVFVDKAMKEGEPRPAVSIYVQEPGRSVEIRELSKRKTDWSPESPGKWTHTRAGDTQPGFLHQAGQDQSANSSVSQASQLRGEPFSGIEKATGQDPAAEVPSPTADTARTVSFPERGLEQPLGQNVAQSGILGRMRNVVAELLGSGEAPVANSARPAATPEQGRAMAILARNPDAIVRTDGGGDMRAADWMASIDEIETKAKTDAAGYEAAVNCALRFPQ